jgi:hypothetical protein
MNPYIQQFNTQLDSFVSDLQVLFKDNKTMLEKINTFKFAQGMIKKINVRKPIEVLIYQIQPFREKILSGDDTYLLEYDYAKEVDTFFDKYNYTGEVKNEKAIGDVINQIKDIYKSLTDGDKEIIRKYFKVLLILGEKALGM